MGRLLRSWYERLRVTGDGEIVVSEGLYSYSSQAKDDPPTDNWRCRYVKRVFDFACAAVASLVFALPAVCVAIAIRITSPGPVFYREQRIGRDGIPFEIWKFRTMHCRVKKRHGGSTTKQGGEECEWRMRKDLKDPRITSVGAVLRRWSLDELPQLYNVLRGEMSLVGPRPIVASEAAFYGDLLAFYLAATPGMSGLWQISGRSNIDYAHRAELDAVYVRTWSMSGDFNILLRTVPAVLGRVGAR